MADPKMREEQRPRCYRVVRMGKLPWTGFNALIWLAENAYEGLANFDQLTDFYGPELIRTGFPIYTAVPGHDTVPPELGTLHIMHGITPETETSCHYFGFSTRNFRMNCEELDAFQLASDIKIRQQDVDAIEAVEARLEEGAARQRELLVKSDGPAVKVRRLIQKMLDSERS